MEESELNITSIFKADKDNLFKSLKNKEIKEESSISKSKTKWSDLPKLYEDQINQCEKHIPEYDRECKFKWIKIKYTKEQELFDRRLGVEENNEKNWIKKNGIEKK